MASLNLSCILVIFFFLSLFFCEFPFAEAGIGDHDQEAIDEIRAYIDSLETNPSLHYWKPADIDESSSEKLSPRSAAKEGTCSANGGKGSCSESSSKTSFSTGLPSAGFTSEKDLANMNMGELMNELIQLTQKHPEEVESVIEMYKQMISAAGDSPH